MGDLIRDPFAPLLRALEAFHHPTYEHCRRVGLVAGLLADAVTGVDPDLARISGELHDVGKLAVTRSRLDPAAPEFDGHPAWLEDHVRIGADLVGAVPSPCAQQVAGAVLEHHRRADGSGYPRPDGPAAIGLLGAVVGLADVVDALWGRGHLDPDHRIEQLVDIVGATGSDWFPPEVLAALEVTVRSRQEELVHALAGSGPYPGPPPAL